MTKDKGTDRLVISVSQECKESLEALAIAHGFLWGADKPNISGLIRAIGSGKISIVKTEQKKK